MKTFGIHRRVAVVLPLAFALAGTHATAQHPAATYPNRPVTLVVPYPPGGANDNSARLIAKRLTEVLGQPVIVDNRAGASGTLGAEYVAKARPDGHTLLYTSSSLLTSAVVMARVPYDPLRSFIPVARVSAAQFVVGVANQVPAATLKEFLDYAKTRPGQLNYGSSGIGSINHFATEALADAAGISLVHVPYRGMAPAMQDLAGGHLPLVVGSVSSMLAQIKGGRVRALAVTGDAAPPQLEGVPTVSTVLPGFSFIGWSGLLAPAGTSHAIVDRLSAEVLRALQDPTLRTALETEGGMPAPLSADPFARAIAIEFERYRALARKNDIRAE